MSVPRCVMLLIDADNVSIGVMTQAVQRLLAEYGALHVRRAYCTAESAVKHQQVFKRLSIKPMVNLAAGKNSTDIAMAVDALDLVLSERPEVVVIASSDSDFAPLVSRLREKGCRVRGIGQKGKTGEETVAVYDDFVELEHRVAGDATAPTTRRRVAASRSTAAAKAAAPGRPSTRGKARAGTATDDSAPATAAAAEGAHAAEAAEAATEATAPKVAAGKSAAGKSAARKTAAAKAAPAKAAPRKRPAAESAEPPAEPPAASSDFADQASAAAGDAAPATARKRAARKSASTTTASRSPVAAVLPQPPAPQPVAPAPAEVLRLVEALGGLPVGATMSLQSAAEQLRKAGLLSRSSSARKLLARHPAWFELEPADDPRRLVRRA